MKVASLKKSKLAIASISKVGVRQTRGPRLDTNPGFGGLKRFFYRRPEGPIRYLRH